MMNMVMMSKQKKARFILNQLKNKPRLHLLLKKRVVFRKPRPLEMVDAETNERIGQALAEHKVGLGIILSTKREIDKYFDMLDREIEEECTN